MNGTIRDETLLQLEVPVMFVQVKPCTLVILFCLEDTYGNLHKETYQGHITFWHTSTSPVTNVTSIGVISWGTTSSSTCRHVILELLMKLLLIKSTLGFKIGKAFWFHEVLLKLLL